MHRMVSFASCIQHNVIPTTYNKSIIRNLNIKGNRMKDIILKVVLVGVMYSVGASAMSLTECANLTTDLKIAEENKDYNKVMNVGGMIFLGCDGHLTSSQMDMVLEAIDRAEKKLK